MNRVVDLYRCDRCVYGVRKMWRAARREGLRIGRDQMCFTPTHASWANPIEAQSGPLRRLVMGASKHPHHPTPARRLQAYLRWRNANARHPDVLAAQRRERARVRSEHHRRWGRPAAA
ncbi:hypothetical protein ACL02T_34445 [Pseudonocardia sp. RS010]|uniref:hypothetical protein n=1 Tax=Pseudonocardia sp. RS010 TaxID=3385979 RepID=UPI00399EFCC4